MTLKVCASNVELCNNQTALGFGVADKGETGSKLITLPIIPVTFLVSTLPLGKITLHFLFVPVNVSKSCVLSTVICVVVAVLILPDLLSPPRTGSFTEITEPGLTIAPASIDVVKLTTSDSFCSLNNIALPNL